jgi:hypothetical protein
LDNEHFKPELIAAAKRAYTNPAMVQPPAHEESKVLPPLNGRTIGKLVDQYIMWLICVKLHSMDVERMFKKEQLGGILNEAISKQRIFALVSQVDATLTRDTRIAHGQAEYARNRSVAAKATRSERTAARLDKAGHFAATNQLAAENVRQQELKAEAQLQKLANKELARAAKEQLKQLKKSARAGEPLAVQAAGVMPRATPCGAVRRSVIQTYGKEVLTAVLEASSESVEPNEKVAALRKRVVNKSALWAEARLLERFQVVAESKLAKLERMRELSERSQILTMLRNHGASVTLPNGVAGWQAASKSEQAEALMAIMNAEGELPGEQSGGGAMGGGGGGGAQRKAAPPAAAAVELPLDLAKDIQELVKDVVEPTAEASAVTPPPARQKRSKSTRRARVFDAGLESR